MTVAVEPLREALLDQTRADAERRLAAADERVEAVLAEAEERGAASVEQARAEGFAAAAIGGTHDEARARRRARTLVLAAKRELCEELHRQALTAAHALRQDPAYPGLLERLSAVARAQLGEGAVLEIDPPGAGGIRASSGARHVDYTLDALVERCLEQLGARLERLWA